MTSLLTTLWDLSLCCWKWVQQRYDCELLVLSVPSSRYHEQNPSPPLVLCPSLHLFIHWSHPPFQSKLQKFSPKPCIWPQIRLPGNPMAFTPSLLLRNPAQIGIFFVKPKTENQVTWIIISPCFKFPFLKVETVMTQPLHHSKNQIEWCCKMAFISLNAAHLWGVETVILSFSVYTFCLNNGLECFCISYWEDIIGYFPNRVVMRTKWVNT